MPKVLITNGDAPNTWYQGKKNRAYDIYGFNDRCFHTKVCGDGTVSRKDGELLYTESEYEELRQQRNKAIEDLAKHGQELATLRQQVAKKQQVELPREVAEAIEFCRDQWKGFSEISVFGWFLDISKFDSSKVGLVIKEFARTRPLDYMSALVNGYTVKKTPEEQLREKVEKLITDWYDAPESDAGFVSDVRQLSAQIVEQAKQLT